MLNFIIFLFVPVDGFDQVEVSLSSEVIDTARMDMRRRNRSCGFDDQNKGWLNEQPIGKKSTMKI